MSEPQEADEAVDILQKLGLKEYEAKCFVALSRIPNGTAKDISDISEVPRTRVYDAARVLESKGLAEVQHSNPQKFRVVDISTAVETLQAEYESRIQELQTALANLEPAQTTEDNTDTQEVWTLSGSTAIEKRILQLIGQTDSELHFLVRGDEVLSDSLLSEVNAAPDRGVDVRIGTVTEEGREKLSASTTDIEVFRAECDWLLDDTTGDKTALQQILVVDSETILISSVHADGNQTSEYATLGSGFDNGLVVLLRRLLSREVVE